MITTKDLIAALEKGKGGLLCRVEAMEQRIVNVDKWMRLIELNIHAGKDVFGEDKEFTVELKWWMDGGDGPYVVVSVAVTGTIDEVIEQQHKQWERLDELLEGDHNCNGNEVILDVLFKPQYVKDVG